MIFELFFMEQIIANHLALLRIKGAIVVTMVKPSSLAVIALLMLCGVAPAARFFLSGDAMGDHTLKKGIRREMATLNTPSGKEFIKQQNELIEWKNRIYRLKEQEIVALFGPKMAPKSYRPGIFACPVFEQEMIVLGGLHEKNRNKSHNGWYEVSDFAALSVKYDFDGVTPAAIFIYFRVDDKFAKLTQWSDLKKRWEWDTEHFNRLKSWLEERQKANAESPPQPPS
jgi:hypothetical protein